MFEYRVSSFLKDKGIYFDYLVTEEATEEEKRRYEKMGSKIYKLPIDNDHGLIAREIKVNREYYHFFKNNKYDIVYADTENALRSIHLLMARMAGIPVRVVHSHNTSLQTESKLSRIISRLLRGMFRFSATDYFACSDMAAEWLFPTSIYKNHEYKLLKNGVDLTAFKYNKEVRESYREKINVNDALVVGNVGRFMPQKNHEFLIEIFDSLHRRNSKSILLLIGEGPLKDKIQQMTQEKGLSDCVLFIGNVNNVNDYLQAIDVFVMPSLFEGLPITGIEAQAAGLPCVFSDAITEQLRVTNLAEYLSLSVDPDEWADRIIKVAKNERRDMSMELEKNGYSIMDTVESLESFYSSHVGGTG